MDSRRSSTLLTTENVKTENKCALRRRFALAGGLLALMLLVAGMQANAAPVHFRYVGGRWGHAYHAGWHRYWGGPSIGFYYAPAPVYLVPGYSAPSYYTGSSFWYSNPSFGLSLNFGGGGGYYGGGYHGARYYHGGHYNGGSHYSGGSFHGGGHYSGGSFHSGGRSGGGSFHGGGRDHR